jgi:hypothetical protein
MYPCEYSFLLVLWKGKRKGGSRADVDTKMG